MSHHSGLRKYICLHIIRSVYAVLPQYYLRAAGINRLFLGDLNKFQKMTQNFIYVEEQKCLSYQ